MILPLRWVSKGLASVDFKPQKYLPLSKKVDGFEWQFVHYSSLYRSEHERQLRRLILERGGDCFSDVGANVGGWSLRATRYFRNVFAFEPEFRTGAILRRNIYRNRALIERTSRVVMFSCALGNQNGRVIFYSNRKGDGGNGSASLTSMNPGNPSVAKHSAPVEVRRFDDLKLPCSRRSLIKIDTEGGEVAVLEGMQETLNIFHPRLVLEWHSPENAVKCKSMLEELGYDVREIAMLGPGYLLAE